MDLNLKLSDDREIKMYELTSCKERSDLTLKLSDGREIKVHKLIIRKKNESLRGRQSLHGGG